MCKKPVIVAGNEIERLNRIPLSGKTFQESWMQYILAHAPEVLPTAYVDGIFAPLVFVAREVEVASGYIDCLYVSAQGYPVIVETKLWRNPEAKRQVVSQIIDYAKDLQGWSFQQLDTVYRDVHGGKGLFGEMVARGYQRQEDEAFFIDTVEKNLCSARFLLMIVGDGIRSDVEKMTEFLNASVNMKFQFALCELEVYELENGRRLVVPQLTAKTEIITRTLLDFDVPAQPASSMEPAQNEEGTLQKKCKLCNAEDWANTTPLQDVAAEQMVEFVNDMQELGFSYHVGTADLTIDFRSEKLNRAITCMWLFGNGKSAAFSPLSYYEILEKNGYSTAIADRLFECCGHIWESTRRIDRMPTKMAIISFRFLL